MITGRLRRARGSLRVRMTLWNVAALAVVLIAFGLGFRWMLRHLLIASLDEDMASQVSAVVRKWESAPPERQRMLIALLRMRPAAGWAALLVGSGASPGPLEGGPTSEGGSISPWKIMDLSGNSYIFGTPLSPWDEDTYRRSVAGTIGHVTIHTPDGMTLRVCSIPVRAANGSGQVKAVIQMARSLHSTNHALAATDRVLLAFLPIALIAAGAVGTLLTDRALSPVGRLSRAAARIEATDLTERLPVEGADEFAGLARTFNGVLSRLERAFEQQRQFTADASHELRSPLTVILGQASLALKEEQTQENRRAWERTARAARTMEQLVRDLLILARSDARQRETEYESVSIRDLLEAAVELVPEGDRAGAAAISIHCQEELRVLGDAGQLVRALHNLLSNALRHTPATGNVTLSATSSASEAVILVTDTGCGIASEHLPRVLERFYRVDQGRARAAGGSGLGLAIVQSIVAAHGGSLTLESRVGQGTTAMIRLPHIP